MSFINRLLGKDEAPAIEATDAAALCPHTTLTPRWDKLDDIGHADRATSFHCEGCGQDFSAADAEALRASESARLHESLPVE